MTGRLRLELQSHGNESAGIPVRVEVMDPAMRPVAAVWGQTPGQVDLSLEAGLYAVRVAVASGRNVALVARVNDEEDTTLPVPLYDLSPHEGHEWAYFTQPMARPSHRTLADQPYEGAWLRLWQHEDEGWRPMPIPEADVERLSGGADGITYRFRPPANRPCLLQTGGAQVPWRCTALPPADGIFVMIKPAETGADYPLDVVVSSGNWRVQTLLSLLRRGDTAGARDWDREARIAEKMLFSKMADPTAAAVGGYFLLRIRDFARLRNWANNLANWIGWMADGPIIHAWQLFAQADGDPERREALTAQARARLLEASARGFPLYTEGLRLLRDGLLGLHRTAKSEDREVEAALIRVAEYLSAADPSLPTTTFLAVAPERPDEEPRMGLPDDAEPMMFVYDVPFQEIVRQGLIPPGSRLVDLGETVEAVMEEDGTLRLDDGRAFHGQGELEVGAAAGEAEIPVAWKIPSLGAWLDDAADVLRSRSFSRIPEAREDRGDALPAGEA
jgi:hypothetical protein